MGKIEELGKIATRQLDEAPPEVRKDAEQYEEFVGNLRELLQPEMLKMIQDPLIVGSLSELPPPAMMQCLIEGFIITRTLYELKLPLETIKEALSRT